MCENYKEEFSSSIDRDEVFDELSERIANYWDITIEWETYEQKTALYFKGLKTYQRRGICGFLFAERI